MSAETQSKLRKRSFSTHDEENFQAANWRILHVEQEMLEKKGENIWEKSFILIILWQSNIMIFHQLLSSTKNVFPYKAKKKFKKHQNLKNLKKKWFLDFLEIS